MLAVSPEEIRTTASFTVGVPDEDGPGREITEIDPELRLAIRRIARTGHLLVGCDYDGTLAPSVDNPNEARPLPESVSVLRHLASLASTTVSVVSGRALRDLAAMSRLPAEIQLVGSHGVEFDLGAIEGLTEQDATALTAIINTVVGITAHTDGTQLEIKPAAIAVHVRRCTSADAEAVLASLHRQFDDDTSVHLTPGKQVLEVSVVKSDKGMAVTRLIEQSGASSTVFIGDDITDETVFDDLGLDDLSIKVGPGDTEAQFRVNGPEDVLHVLSLLGEERQAWLAGANAVPIEQHSLLSDGTDVALLTPDGSVSWLCYPNPDAPAIFASLLGDVESGHFTIRPRRGGRPLSQRYVENTMTVRTNWSGVTVTDYLDSSNRNVAGKEDRLHLVRVISGREPVEVTFAPRPQFGSVPVGLAISKNGIRVTGTSDPLALIAPGLQWQITQDGPHSTAKAIADPTDGDIVIELLAGSDEVTPSPVPEADRRVASHQPWQEFIDSLTIPEQYESIVKRSALTLAGLVHRPTGSALAAATTSLPEWIGGIRNWDYRYCWLRDAAMTVGAISLVGRTNEADAYIDWLTEVMEQAVAPERVHPLYTLDGSILGPEAVVDTLSGYAGSRPVRIGNAAQGQVQLDVFGPVVQMIADTARARGRVSGRDLAIVNSCVEAVSRRWNEPDHGIWEIRDAPRDHVHSRVTCWQAVDRGLQVVRQAGSDRPDWQELADTIRDQILEQGWNEQAGTFVSAYGRDDVDAACLAVITTGLIDGTDPRAVGTINAVEASLRDGPTVYRYRHDDGLPGTEGGMHICTTWLIEAYAMAGMTDEATDLFEQLLECAGATGLLSEMYDAGTNRGLGNHPQAYSHLGVIRCALALASQ